MPLAAAAITWVFALLLAVAGVRKITAPAATSAALHTASLPSDVRLVRLFGGGEVVLGAAVLLLGGSSAAALAIAYAGFAVFAARQSRRGADCGCFGAASAPASPLHVAINVAGAGTAALATLWGAPPVTALAGGRIDAVVVVALVAVGAAVLQLCLTALPELAAARAQLTSEAAQ